MNPKIKELIEELRRCVTASGGIDCRDPQLFFRTASILQAVFDPENQPSQYGTTLVSD